VQGIKAGLLIHTSSDLREVRRRDQRVGATMTWRQRKVAARRIPTKQATLFSQGGEWWRRGGDREFAMAKIGGGA
jgi:hypothetical protein